MSMTEPLRAGDQPAPTHNDHPAVQPAVLEDLRSYAAHVVGPKRDELVRLMHDIEIRAEIGRERYGTYLQPFNGRNALVDAYEEAMDLLIYLKQMALEGNGTPLAYSSARSIALELRAQLTAQGVVA